MNNLATDHYGFYCRVQACCYLPILGCHSRKIQVTGRRYCDYMHCSNNAQPEY